MKKLLKQVVSFSLSAVLALSAFGGVSAQENEKVPAALKEGVNIIREGATDTSYTIDEGRLS